MPSLRTDLWARYVLALRTEERLSQTEFALRALGKKSQQGKISRWEAGESNPPDRAADVADFARALGRNPLEAFVAAGMLDIEEAGRGLALQSRRLLATLADESDPTANLRLVAKKGQIEGPGENSI